MLVRPSGTEPKLKMYVDATRAAADLGDPFETERSLEAHAGAVASDLVDHVGL